MVAASHDPRGTRFFGTLGGFSFPLWHPRLQLVTFTCTQAHARCRRIFASTYSKTAIYHPRTQKITSRTEKLLKYIHHCSTLTSAAPGSNSPPIVVWQAFPALQVDIFKAFAFSEAHGTEFLGNTNPSLRKGNDDGNNDTNPMSVLDLFHDEKRAEYFFRESECLHFLKGFYLCWTKPVGYGAHLKAQKWMGEIIASYEGGKGGKMGSDHDGYLRREENYDGDDGVDCSTYQKLLRRRNPDTGRGLDWNDRASEIMDHISKFHPPRLPPFFFPTLIPFPLSSGNKLHSTSKPLTLLVYTLLTPTALSLPHMSHQTKTPYQPS